MVANLLPPERGAVCQSEIAVIVGNRAAVAAAEQIAKEKQINCEKIEELDFDR